MTPPIETAPPFSGKQTHTHYDEDEENEENVYLSVPPRPLHAALLAPLSRPLLSAAVLLCAASAATAAFVLHDSETNVAGSLSAALQQQPEASPEAEQPSREAPEQATATPVQEVEETAPPQPPQPAPEPEVASGGTDGRILPDPRPASLSPPPDSEKPAAEKEEKVAAAEREPAPEDGGQSTESPASTTQTETAAETASESEPAPEPEPIEAVSGVPTPEQVAALVGHPAQGAGESAASTSSNLVATVQRALMWRGYDPGPVDGVEGAKTRAAVRAFQRQLGVSADGEIDLVLLRQLRSVETAPGAEELGSALPELLHKPEEKQLASAATGSSASAAETAAAEPVQLNASLQSDPSSQQSPVVAEVQRALRLHGYDPGPINGIAGPQTQSAARAFQRRAGLEVDGEIDADLLQSLNRTDAPALRESAGNAGSSDNAGNSEDSDGLTQRLESAVDSVADLFGLQRGGEVDPDLAQPSGESDTR